jgi:hypothetical protein
MGNPQGKAKEADIAWLAGFWDGEGTVSLQFRNGHLRTRNGLISPYVQLCGTSVVALERTHTILNDLGVGHHIQWPTLRPHPRAMSKLPQGRLSVQGMKRVAVFLQTVGPYLVVKAEPARIVGAFIALRAAKTTNTPYEDAEWDLLTQIRTTSLKQRPSVEAA